jgi:hypothetical protein
MITPYDNEVREASERLKIACNKKDYPAIRTELDHLHVLYINVELSYAHAVSGVEKVLNKEGISKDAKPMLEFLLSDLKKDEEKIGEGLKEIINKQNEYSFLERNLTKMKLQLLMISFTNSHIMN